MQNGHEIYVKLYFVRSLIIFDTVHFVDSLDVDIGVKKHKLVSLQSVNPRYGNGFVINERWKRNIYWYWKVSDRVSVLKLNTNQKVHQIEIGINIKSQVKKSYICKPLANSSTRVRFCRRKINKNQVHHTY